MLLCVDIGNTNIKLGLFAGKEMRVRWRFSTDRGKLADEYAMLIRELFESQKIAIEEVTGCAISSVVPALTDVFVELAERYLKVKALIFSAETVTEIAINTDYPREVGPDLIMNAYAARELYGAPVIVVTFGTATAFVAVSAAGNLEGVAIAPGVLSSTESLFRSASALPRVALAHPSTVIGKNTTQSMRAGIVFGFASLVEGVVVRMKAELGGNPRVIATGGLASMIAPETKVIDAVVPNLALLGLQMLYSHRQGEK